MSRTTPYRRLARGFAIASTLGTGFAAAVGLGVYLGIRCDEALGWRPVGFTIAFGLIGGGAGVVFILRTLAALDRSERRRDREGP